MNNLEKEILKYLQQFKADFVPPESALMRKGLKDSLKISVPQYTLLPSSKEYYTFTYKGVRYVVMPFGVGTNPLTRVYYTKHGEWAEDKIKSFDVVDVTETLFGIHGAGGDYIWGDLKYLSMMRALNMPILYLSHGININYSHIGAESSMVRIFTVPDHYKSPKALWNELRNDVVRWYQKGFRKFVLFNEVNFPSEGRGILWSNPYDFANYLIEFIGLLKVDMPDAELYYPAMTKAYGDHWYWIDNSWPKVKHLFKGFTAHVYVGHNGEHNLDKSVKILKDEILEFRNKYCQNHKLSVTELSVNRYSDVNFKAKVYRQLEEEINGEKNLESIFYFISHWSHHPEYGENWFDTGLAEAYISY